jgi:PAS domain-containing protein
VNVEDEEHYRLILINQAFCNMTGLAEEEIRGGRKLSE